MSSSFSLPEPSRPQGTAGLSSALTARAQATRASTGWRALWTKQTRSSVANAMEDEHAAEHGPRAGSMRDGGLEKGECDAGEEPEEHLDDGGDEDEEEGEVHQGDSGGGEDTGAVDYAETSTEMTIPGIINACSTPLHRTPDLSSAPHFSSTAPCHCAPRNCAPRTSRSSANRVAQLPPRNSRRAAAPAYRANSFTPNQQYHICLPPGPMV